MKILALLAILCSALPAFGATDDPADPSSANLINLTYYPHPANFRLTPTVSSVINGQTNGYDLVQQSYTLGVAYGLPLEGLRVAVSEGDSTTGYNRDGHSSFYISGLSDPTIDLLYRIVDSAPGGWSVDAEISFSPGIGTRYVASSRNPGTNARGGSTIEASASAFWRLAFNEAELAGHALYIFSASTTNATNSDSSYTSDGTWAPSFSLTDRVHLCPHLYLEGVGAFYFGDTTDVTFSGGGTGTSQLPFHVIPTVRAGYLANKQLVLAASIDYASYAQNNSTATNFRETAWALSATIEL